MEKQIQSAENILLGIIQGDARYDFEAYRFCFQALDYTVETLGEKRHVTGRELLRGIRELAIQEFGPLAQMVLNNWGVYKTEDFGHIVFNLVKNNLMSKTEEDSVADFRGIYDFNEAFGDVPIEIRIH